MIVFFLQYMLREQDGKPLLGIMPKVYAVGPPGVYCQGLCLGCMQLSHLVFNV